MVKKDTRTRQERRADRKRLFEIMQQAGLQCESVADVQELFKDMVAMTLENGLEGELDEELGYTKYDYRNKQTDNSRNGYSEKTLKSSLGEMEIAVPRDRKGSLSHSWSRRTKRHSAGTLRKRSFPCMPRA